MEQTILSCWQSVPDLSPSYLPVHTQSLILAVIAYYWCTPWTFYHHKIALNYSFPTAPVSLNLAQRLLRYKPIFACTPHVHHVHPITRICWIPPESNPLFRGNCFFW